MTRILHLMASPRREESRTAAIAQRFIDRWREREPAAEVDELDLWREPLPEFDGDKAAAKLTVITGGMHTSRTRSAWDEITAIAQRFIAADVYVLSVPMWNGSVPYRLKLYIDLITQPGLLFGFDPAHGYHGLLSGKRALAIYASGVFAPGAAPSYGQDFHSTYVDWWLRSAGIERIETVRAQPLIATPEPARVFEAALRAAEGAADRLA